MAVFKKDSDSKAVINTDISEYQRLVEERNRQKQLKRIENDLRWVIDQIKNIKRHMGIE